MREQFSTGVCIISAASIRLAQDGAADQTACCAGQIGPQIDLHQKRNNVLTS
jgi:hypothetical protein